MPFPIPATLRRYRDGLQTMPWMSLIGYGALILLYGVLASLFLPREWRPPFMRFLLLASSMLLVAKDIACLPLHVARIRAAWVRGDTWPRLLYAAIPPAFLAYLRLERAMWRGFFGWMLRRAQPARPAGLALGYLERGSYGTVICCLLVALLVEAPIDVMIASLMAKTPEQLRLLHIGFGIMAAYSLVWILGDRWHVSGRRQHVLTAASLELDIGARGNGSIPLDSIINCERITESCTAWCKRHRYPLHAARKVTPCDAPNVVVTLVPGCDVRLTLLQSERGGDGPIFLYLDRPEQLIAAVRSPLR
jgi:hypothetical protein